MHPVVTICAMLSLSGVLCGSAYAEPTIEEFLGWSSDVRHTVHALNEVNAISKICSDKTNEGMDTQLFYACTDFYRLYGKHLQAVLNEGNASITTITIAK